MTGRPRRLALLACAWCLLAARPEATEAPPQPPTLEDWGYFLSRLDEDGKARALNVLSDLAAESRLDRAVIGQVLRRLLDEGPPPEDYGYRQETGFQRRLSDLLRPLRLRGPEAAPPQEAVFAVRLDDRFLDLLDAETRKALGGSVPTAARALLAGTDLGGRFQSWAWARYHGKGADPKEEPAFFSDADALAAHERRLGEPMDAWDLARWLGLPPPRNRYEPGFILLFFDPRVACAEVRIPTAADTEDPAFRPTPASEQRSGFTDGGAPQWVCPNFPLTQVRRSRYVPHDSYIHSIR